MIIYTFGVSTEPLETIRANECDATPGLATSRFRALWNEIARLRDELQRARNAIHDECPTRCLAACVRVTAALGGKGSER